MIRRASRTAVLVLVLVLVAACRRTEHDVLSAEETCEKLATLAGAEWGTPQRETCMRQVAAAPRDVRACDDRCVRAATRLAGFEACHDACVGRPPRDAAAAR